jgi:hypothetical protein
MFLDISTLYLVATMMAAMLGAMLMFFGRQENIPALKWWGTAYLIGAASVALWTLIGSMLGGNAFGAMLSLALTSVGFFACGMVWNASRVFHGRSPNLPQGCPGNDSLCRGSMPGFTGMKQVLSGCRDSERDRTCGFTIAFLDGC